MVEVNAIVQQAENENLLAVPLCPDSPSCHEKCQYVGCESNSEVYIEQHYLCASHANRFLSLTLKGDMV